MNFHICHTRVQELEQAISILFLHVYLGPAKLMNLKHIYICWSAETIYSCPHGTTFNAMKKEVKQRLKN